MLNKRTDEGKATMKKLLFIALAEYENPADGVGLKIHSQINGMRELGYDVDCAAYGKDGVYVFGRQRKILLKKNAKMPRRILFLSAVLQHLTNQKYDLCYIRFPYIDWKMKKIMKYLKNYGTQIYMEIASYPVPIPTIKKNGLAATMLYRSSNLLVRDLSRYVHRVFYVGTPANKIWGCDSVRIANGCDVNRYPLKQMTKNTDEIVLIAVAGMFQVHGFERLLEGMAQYYEGEADKIIKLHLVGEGPQLNFYKKICVDNHISQHVCFHGALAGKALDELFDISDIAIGSLGMYKENFVLASTLKVKEYLSRGIPFVYACEEEDLESTLPFVWKVQNTDSVLNIGEIISFHDSLLLKDYRTEMREYAKEHFSWKTIFSKAGL